MAWIFLLIAGAFEVSWAVGMKYCDGLKPSFALLFVIVSMTLSVVFLWLATKTIPMSVAYAVWCGIGMIGVFVYGALVLKEPVQLTHIFFVGLIIAGVVGLKLNVNPS